MKIGVVITASFCTLKKVLIVLKELIENGYDLYPVLSNKVIDYDTRFGKAEDFVREVEEITGKTVIKDIVEAEKFGPIYKMDAMLVLPATGDFMAKMANSITDNAANLAVKATLRNQSPIVIAVSTNDGLGLSAGNIAKLMNLKYVYYVPYGQDDFEKKKNELWTNCDGISV